MTNELFGACFGHFNMFYHLKEAVEHYNCSRSPHNVYEKDRIDKGRQMHSLRRTNPRAFWRTLKSKGTTHDASIDLYDFYEHFKILVGGNHTYDNDNGVNDFVNDYDNISNHITTYEDIPFTKDKLQAAIKTLK